MVPNSIISIWSQGPGVGRNVANQIASHVGEKRGVIVGAQDAHISLIVIQYKQNNNNSIQVEVAQYKGKTGKSGF